MSKHNNKYLKFMSPINSCSLGAFTTTATNFNKIGFSSKFYKTLEYKPSECYINCDQFTSKRNKREVEVKI